MFTKRRSQRETLLNGKNSINNNTVILLAQTKPLFSVRMNCFVLYCILISKHLLKKNKKQKNKQKKPPPPPTTTKNPPELMLYSFLLKKFLLCSFCVILILYHRNWWKLSVNRYSLKNKAWSIFLSVATERPLKF